MLFDRQVGQSSLVQLGVAESELSKSFFSKVRKTVLLMVLFKSFASLFQVEEKLKSGSLEICSVRGRGSYRSPSFLSRGFALLGFIASLYCLLVGHEFRKIDGKKL